jgi:hypothetical protein
LRTNPHRGRHNPEIGIIHICRWCVTAFLRSRGWQALADCEGILKVPCRDPPFWPHAAMPLTTVLKAAANFLRLMSQCRLDVRCEHLLVPADRWLRCVEQRAVDTIYHQTAKSAHDTEVVKGRSSAATSEPRATVAPPWCHDRQNGLQPQQDNGCRTLSQPGSADAPKVRAPVVVVETWRRRV